MKITYRKISGNYPMVGSKRFSVKIIIINNYAYLENTFIIIKIYV